MDEKRRNRLGLIAIGFGLIALLSAYLFRLRAPEPSLPQSIGAMQLQKELRGDDARRIINQMHGKGVTPTDNLIGIYSHGGANATVYLSLYETSIQSDDVLQRMVRGIERSDTPFTSLKRRQVHNVAVATCIGMGQAHYFFSVDERLYWLAVDVPMTEVALTEFIVALNN